MSLGLSQKYEQKGKDYFPAYFAIAILAIFLISFPAYFLIIDEIYYYQQGVAYFSGEGHLLINTIFKNGETQVYHSFPGQYPLGIPLLVALFSKIVGSKSIFLIGGISLSGSIFLLGKTLAKANISPKWSSLILCFLPAVVLSRSIMSGMPSMLLTSIFLYLLLKEKNLKIEIILAGFIVGISILFRETNIIFLGILSLPFFIKNKYSLLFILGGLLGSIIRPILTFTLYQEIFHYKASSGFSLENLGTNVLLYAIALMIFIPFGAVALASYKGKYHKEIKVSVILYTFLFLFYNYNGIQESGLKSLILTPRFLLPILPLLIWVTAYFFERKLGKYKDSIANIFVGLSLVGYMIFSYIAYTFDAQRQELIQFLEVHDSAIYVMTNYRDEPKYFNAFTPTRKRVKNNSQDIQALLDQDEKVYWVDLKRQGVLGKNNNFASSSMQLQGGFKKKQIFQQSFMDGQFVEIHELTSF
jgi:hypothetical protein